MDAMDERATECPQCQNSTAVYKHLEFHITPCGHSLCFDCADRHLPRLGSAIPCKTKLSDTTHCGFTITKNGLIPENGSDPFISKEMAKRRKVLETYNATEEDFPTLAEYYQYQEEIEEIIYNLLGSDGAEITKTTARIKAYYDAHQDEIRMRADRKASHDGTLSSHQLPGSERG